MEPNKNIENQFKDKLNAREMQPSTMAWNRLDTMLNIAEHKRPKRRYNWLFFAAGFIGIIVSVFVVYQLKLNEVTSNATVATVQKKATKKIQTKIHVIPDALALETSLSQNQNNSLVNSKKLIINQKAAVNLNQINKLKDVVVQNESIENQKVLEIAKQNIKVNSADLLATAENSEVKQPKTFVSIEVNATRLLSEVNGELSQEFRETKFQRLKRNIQSVKVAMNARNNK
ncbi:MAG: hypothetical protein H7221_06130 [Flavobacterium sp.]|nr:hypothetical protein [Flavobacterium sp.]